MKLRFVTFWIPRKDSCTCSRRVHFRLGATAVKVYASKSVITKCFNFWQKRKQINVLRSVLRYTLDVSAYRKSRRLNRNGLSYQAASDVHSTKYVKGNWSVNYHLNKTQSYSYNGNILSTLIKQLPQQLLKNATGIYRSFVALRRI